MALPVKGFLSGSLFRLRRRINRRHEKTQLSAFVCVALEAKSDEVLGST